MTYSEVYHLIFNRPHKRRAGVLGYWHELKLAAWQEHLDTCGVQPLEACQPAPAAEAFHAW